MKLTHRLQGWRATRRAKEQLRKKACAECGTMPNGLAVPEYRACSDECALQQWAQHTA
jgi:hypothetical protein